MRFNHARDALGNIFSPAAVPALLAWILIMPAATAGVPPPGVHALLQELEGDGSSLTTQDNPQFGYSVAVSEFHLLVGCPFHEDLESGEERGLAPWSGFGWSLAGDENGWAMVGAPGFPVPGEGPRGRVFVYGYPGVLFSDRFEQEVF